MVLILRNVYPLGDGSQLCSGCLEHLKEIGEPNNITCGKEMSNGLPVYGWVRGVCSGCAEDKEKK